MHEPARDGNGAGPRLTAARPQARRSCRSTRAWGGWCSRPTGSAARDEVIVIAAALSIQDPRERPADKQAQADQLHARFADESSDFLAFLNLWRYLREQQRELSGNQFRKRCQAEYLHFLRVREWQDLVAQLRQAAKGAGVSRSTSGEADPQAIHTALLSGPALARGPARRRPAASTRARAGRASRSSRARRWPGSSPTWVMAAELVETSRLWGRDRRADPARLGRAARRPPRPAHLLRAALGAAPRRRSWRPSG